MDISDLNDRLRFNSTMVRLKGEDGILVGTSQAGFQFHNGSIKSLNDIYSDEEITSFNSTMVRLKAENASNLIL